MLIYMFVCFPEGDRAVTWMNAAGLISEPLPQAVEATVTRPWAAAVPV
jgi:hypothetical protein